MQTISDCHLVLPVEYDTHVHTHHCQREPEIGGTFGIWNLFTCTVSTGETMKKILTRLSLLEKQ